MKKLLKVSKSNSNNLKNKLEVQKFFELASESDLIDYQNSLSSDTQDLVIARVLKVKL